MCKFRDLRADEIDCRVQSVKENGLVLLLYKDARVDMNILDETVGAANWQNRFYEHKGILFCSLGINTNYNIPDSPDRWVWKDDAGVESNTEAEKGNASDARKRAGTAFGIGRELYTSPFIWIPASKCNIRSKKAQNGKEVLECKDEFSVGYIKIENKVITELIIHNDSKDEKAFHWEKAKGTNKAQQPQAQQMTYEQALSYVYKEGKYPEKTIAEIYKTDIAYINELGKSETTPKDVITALCIINEEIKKARANKQ